MYINKLDLKRIASRLRAERKDDMAEIIEEEIERNNREVSGSTPSVNREYIDDLRETIKDAVDNFEDNTGLKVDKINLVYSWEGFTGLDLIGPRDVKLYLK